MVEYELHEGDCLKVLKNIQTEKADLIYLDPPFLTQKEHRLSTRSGDKEYSFSDKWSSYEEYSSFIKSRLEEIRRVLKSSGSVFFHCDRSASHIVRLALEDVFGKDRFVSEIIWYYRRWSNTTKKFLPAHQNIYFFSKTEDYKFNTMHQEYSPSTNVDQILQERKRDENGKAVYNRDEDGEIVTSGGKEGVPMRDVWDIPYLNPKAKERVGYPTQKPVILLERIIRSVTDEGDLVIDPFCGSGTTLVAASLLGRKSIGIDVSDEAISVSEDRMDELVKTDSDLMKSGRESYRDADEDILDVLSGLNYAPVHRNDGIDAVLSDDIDGKPILLKVQRQQETASEAARKLLDASEGKKPGLLIVVKTSNDEQLSLASRIPQAVEVVDSAAHSVNKAIDEKKKATAG